MIDKDGKRHSDTRPCPNCGKTAVKLDASWVCAKCGHHINPVYRLGVDLGQSDDPTALAAVECLEGGHFGIRQLGKLPLLTPYTEVAKTVMRAAERLRAKSGSVAVYVDATGVGAPVIDMLQGPLRELAVLRPVQIQFGDALRQETRKWSGKGLTVGKEYLISRLTALFQTGRIRGERTPEHEELMAQLHAFEGHAKVTHDVYGARSGAHDDLVIALALAVLEDTGSVVTGLHKLNAAIPGHDAVLTLDPEPLTDWQW